MKMEPVSSKRPSLLPMKSHLCSLVLAIAMMASVGISLSKDSETSAKPPQELVKAANAGDADAQNKLGDFYRQNPQDKPNFSEALRWYLRSARQKYSAAQFMLGHMYQDGEGTERNNVEAYKWFELSRLSGFADAVYARDAVGALLAEKQLDEAKERAVGFMERGDPSALTADAIKRLNQAKAKAVDGDLEAQVEIGIGYLFAEESPFDEGEAFKWLKTAAERGHPEAQQSLGLMYRSFDLTTVHHDDANAVLWFRRSALQGSKHGQNSLAISYWKGWGVEKDIKEAYFWWLVAERGGHKGAQSGRSFLEKEFSPEQMSEIRKRAEGFQPKPEIPPAPKETKN